MLALALALVGALDSVKERTAARNSHAVASPPSMTLGMLEIVLSEKSEQRAVMNSSLAANTLNTCKISFLRLSRDDDDDDGSVPPFSVLLMLLGRRDNDLVIVESEEMASEGDEALTNRSICWRISTSDILSVKDFVEPPE